MTSMYDADPKGVIEETAKTLKSSLSMPKWALFVKTGHFKAKPPAHQEWWFLRGASILRKVYTKGTICVNRLKMLYGGKKNRGHSPEKRFAASGKIIRVLLQQLEKAELIKPTQIGIFKGRVITPKGKSMMDKLSRNVKKEVKQRKAPEVSIPKVEVPKQIKKPTEKVVTE